MDFQQSSKFNQLILGFLNEGTIPIVRTHSKSSLKLVVNICRNYLKRITIINQAVVPQEPMLGIFYAVKRAKKVEERSTIEVNKNTIIVKCKK